MVIPSSSTHLNGQVTGCLRILQTTDLHMQLLAYDYFADRPDQSVGLIGLADTIQALQSDQNTTTLLCDNGDLIQGNPLADYLAQHLKQGDPHPMLQALNILGYDAMTLGNHEFDYGLDVLRNALNAANFPIVSANLSAANGPALSQPYVVLERQIVCHDGMSRPIKIGITGFGPPQTADWDEGTHNNTVIAGDIVEDARRVVPKIQRAGADLIIALCHSGIGAMQHKSRMENAAVPLAAIDGIDVILTGHTHEVFPDVSRPVRQHVDPISGTLHGKPAVMASFCGKSLGVIDLDLAWRDENWTISGHNVRLEPVVNPIKAQSPLQKKLSQLIAAPHAATRAQMGAPIAQTAIQIQSYFATVQPDLSQQILAQAMQKKIRSALHSTEFAASPVIAATSSYRFGGRSGLGHYIDIPPGSITLRDAAAIFPFADTLSAAHLTGKQLCRWLERAASHYNTATAGVRDQPLLNPLNPGYNCDTVYGVSYQIDLTQPPRFDIYGVEINPKAQRVKNLRYCGALVSESDMFVIATNSFRAKGGGGFPALPRGDILLTTSETLRDILIDHLTEVAVVIRPVEPTWSFCEIADTAASFPSAPQAKLHMSGPVQHIGTGHDGFDTYQINF